MSTDNIVDLAAARANRPAKAAPVEHEAPTPPAYPKAPAPAATSWAEVFQETEANEQYSCALVVACEASVADLADIIEGGALAGWKPTTLQSKGNGQGIVMGMAITPRTLPGGAS